MRHYLVPILLVIAGCSNSKMAAFNGDSAKGEWALEEVRIELGDVKHALNATQVQLHLLEERVSHTKEVDNISQQVAILEKKIAQLEKVHERTVADLRHLNHLSGQTAEALSEYKDKCQDLDQRFDELAKLKGTLTSISKSLAAKPAETSTATYRIQPGDSLEKIARRYNTTVETLKKLNRLENDRIIVGKDLNVPE